ERYDPFARAVCAFENFVPEPDLCLFSLISGSGFFDRAPVAGAVDPEIIVVVPVLASLFVLTSLSLTVSSENCHRLFLSRIAAVRGTNGILSQSKVWRDGPCEGASNGLMVVLCEDNSANLYD